MTPKEILTSVCDLALEENLKPDEIIHIQRYFLALHCCWLTQRTIGELTGCKHDTVSYSLKRVKLKYELATLRIGNKLKKLI